MIQDQFNSLDESFGLGNDGDMSSLELIEQTKSQMLQLRTEAQSLVKMVDDGADFEDLRISILTSIDRTNKFMDVLEEQVIVGVGPGMFTAVSEMINALTSQQKELRALYQTRADVGLKIMKLTNDAKKAEVIDNPSSGGSIRMTSQDLLDMMNAAKNSNFMNAIDAHFEVKDD